jgi:hypothetical protein
MCFVSVRERTHFVHTFKMYPNLIFCEQRTGSRDTAKWPARSPEFSPLNFWLWGKPGDFGVSTLIVTSTGNACQEIQVGVAPLRDVEPKVALKCIEAMHEYDPYLSRQWFLCVDWELFAH